MTANPISLANMTDEAKRGLLVALVRDLSGSEKCHLRIADPQGDLFIHAFPANARELAERAMHSASPEYMARLARAAATPENSMTVEEFLIANRERDIGE